MTLMPIKPVAGKYNKETGLSAHLYLQNKENLAHVDVFWNLNKSPLKIRFCALLIVRKVKTLKRKKEKW